MLSPLFLGRAGEVWCVWRVGLQCARVDFGHAGELDKRVGLNVRVGGLAGEFERSGGFESCM